MKQAHVFIFAAFIASCGVQSSEVISLPAPAANPSAAPAVTAGEVAPKAPPIAARELGAALSFTAPEGWVAGTPTSKMRVAQFQLPKADTDSEDGELVVFNFGAAGGGGVEANLARWASQFTQDDGSDSAARLQRSERNVAGLVVTEVRLAGTYVAETFPGSGVRVNKPGFALLAAIVDNGDNDYYVKCTGPAATLEKHAAAFRAYVSSAK